MCNCGTTSSASRDHALGIEQDRSLLEGPLDGLAAIYDHLLAFLQSRGILHDCNGLPLDCNELDEDIGPVHIQLGDIAVQPAEDAGVVAA